MIRKHISITEQLEEFVQREADNKGIGFSEMLRKIIDAFKEKQKRK